MLPRILFTVFLAAGASLAGCAAEVKEWKAGDEVNAIRFDKAILGVEGRLIMDGKDYGPYTAADSARLEKDRDGNVRLLVNGEVRSPTGLPLPKSLLAPEG